MQTIYMKIHKYEEQSGSLLVSFASDTTKSSDPDAYPEYAYQPAKVWPDVTDTQEIVKRLALAGVGLTQQQEAEEKFQDDPVRVDALKNLVGNSFQYDLGSLNPTEYVEEI